MIAHAYFIIVVSVFGSSQLVHDHLKYVTGIIFPASGKPMNTCVSFQKQNGHLVEYYFVLLLFVTKRKINHFSISSLN